MRKITCAIVLVDKDGNILGCHGTGKPVGFGYDFPKGCADEDEEDIDAAKRELYEECGLLFVDLKNISVVPDVLIDLGVYKHNKEKDIHLYMCPVCKFPNISDLCCDSYFERDGKTLPEIDGYDIISKQNRTKFNAVLWNKFHIIDEHNKDVVYT